jgi:dUTP pyrophosphatase
MNEQIHVKIKMLDERAVMPYRATIGSAGFDVTATSMKRDKNNNIVYGLGFALEIEQGYFAMITNRSSIKNKDLRIHTGVIDSDYTGELFAVFSETAAPAKIYAVGDRVAQLLILPCPAVQFEKVDELTKTQRGAGGFGHTDKKQQQ